MMIIEDLKSDLQIRDEEYEEQSRLLEKFKEQNDYLKKQLNATKLNKLTIESKLNAMAQVKEIDENFAKIFGSNEFFEKKKNKISQLNANLSNSVKDQHKSSLSVAYAAKYARIWLEKVRERKAERAMDAERLKDAL